MAIETERKFVVNQSITDIAKQYEVDSFPYIEMKQGYLCSSDSAVTRVRVLGDSALLTIKGRAPGISRPEYEYNIPTSDAEELLALCSGKLDKTRYFISDRAQDIVWEIDVFQGSLAPLVLAEVECSADRIGQLTLPGWLGKEVSEDIEYSNHSLSTNGIPAVHAIGQPNKP